MNRNRWFWPYIILAIAVLCLGIGALTEKHPAVVYVYGGDAKFTVEGAAPPPEVVSPVLLVIDEYGNETCQWNYSWGIDVDYCPWVTPVWPTPVTTPPYLGAVLSTVETIVAPRPTPVTTLEAITSVIVFKDAVIVSDGIRNAAYLIIDIYDKGDLEIAPDEVVLFEWGERDSSLIPEWERGE